MPKCKSDEILNPKTKRCVKKSGKIGRALLLPPPPTRQSTSRPLQMEWSSGIYIPAYLRDQIIQQEKAIPTTPIAVVQQTQTQTQTLRQQVQTPQTHKCTFRPILTETIPNISPLSERIINNTIRSIISEIVLLTSKVAHKKILRKNDVQSILSVIIPNLPIYNGSIHPTAMKTVEVCIAKTASKNKISIKPEKQAVQLIVSSIYSLIHAFDDETFAPVFHNIKNLYDVVPDGDILTPMVVRYF